MKLFGRSKKKNLQERKLTLIQQIKGIEGQLNSMKVRDLNPLEMALVQSKVKINNNENSSS